MQFEWDKGNKTKNWEKHGVSCGEAEECFYNPHIVLYDKLHSQDEERYFLFGKTNSDKFLIIVFTVREKEFIRIISARPMDKKERKFYEENEKNSTFYH